MKKLFVSCPMKGRTEEDIRKSIHRMHKMAEAAFDQELELIPSYIEHNPPSTNHMAVWYLGQSIALMADADYFVGIGWEEDFKGCNIENEVAKSYDIPRLLVDVEVAAPEYIPTWKREQK